MVLLLNLLGLETGSKLGEWYDAGKINIAQQACICAYESHLGFQGNVKRTRTRNLRAKTAINEANMFHTQNIEKSISYAALELSRCNKLLFNNQNRNR